MRYRSTIFVVVLALIGVVAMILAGGTDTARRRTISKTQRLLTPAQFPVDEIARITMKRPSDKTVVFERQGANWSQIQPFAYPMDPFSIRQLAVLAGELEIFDRIDPADLHGGPSLATLALQPAAAEIIYEWSGGTMTIQCGRRSVAGRAYVRLAGDNTIYVVNQKLHERAVEMDPKEWRDRTIFQNVGVESSAIEWQNGPVKLALVRERKHWKMVEPVRTRIDPTARDAYLQALNSAKNGGFIFDQPAPEDLAKFGLSAPVLSLKITTPKSPGNATTLPDDAQKLLVGSRVGATSQDRFAMIEGRPVVVRLSGPVLAALFRQPHDLADPVVSGVNPADVKSIVIRKGQSELKLDRDLERWRAPEHGGNEVNPAHVQELLDQLTKLRAPAVEFKPYPHELEVATITLFGYDAKAVDTVRIAQEKDSGRWMLENGDDVLRLFPPSMKIRMTAEDFGL